MAKRKKNKGEGAAKAKRGATRGATAEIEAERSAHLEEQVAMLQEELAMLRDEWQQEVAFLQGKLADSERARQELAAWIAAAGHHESREDPHEQWMGQVEHDLKAAHDEAYRLGARAWALRQISARLQRERQLLEDRIAAARADGQRATAAERRRVAADLARHSNSLRGTRRDAADDLRLLRADLATLLGSSARLNDEIKRACAATAAGADTTDRLPVQLVDRVQVASARAEELAKECERLNEQVLALDSEISVAIPRLPGAAAEGAEEAPPPPPPPEPAPETGERRTAPELRGEATRSEDITLGFRLREQMMRQRSHLRHWEKLTRDMTVAGESVSDETAPPAASAASAEARPAESLVAAPPAPVPIEARHDDTGSDAAREPAAARTAPEPEPATGTVGEGRSEIELAAESAMDLEAAVDLDATVGRAAETAVPTEFQPNEILILDDSTVGPETTRRLQEFGFTVSLCTSATDLSPQIGKRRIVSAAVNLAMPNAWGAVRRLRSIYRRPGSRLYAYAVSPDVAGGAWLGPIDLYFLSAAGDSALAQLRELEPVLRRVLITTGDPGAIQHIQRELGGAGVVTRTVADVRECEATLKEFLPQVGIVHLSPRYFEAFPVMGLLRATLATRDIPLLFVIDASAHPRDVAFFSAGLRTLAEREALTTAKLVNHLSLNLKVTARFIR